MGTICQFSGNFCYQLSWYKLSLPLLRVPFNQFVGDRCVASVPSVLCLLLYKYCVFLLGLSRPEGESIGVGLDCCLLPTRHKGIHLVQTTDLYPALQLENFVSRSHSKNRISLTNPFTSFYPLVEDPYMQVKRVS